MLLLSKLSYRGDSYYLLRAKFTNDCNFFVREFGRGSGMEERSLEIGEVLRGGGRRIGDDGDRRQVYTYYFGKICDNDSCSIQAAYVTKDMKYTVFQDT